MDEYIRLAGTVSDSIVDGEGLRYVIFSQGCRHHCKNCHNEHSWDENGGKLYKIDDLIKDAVNNPLTDGVTFSGGEPILQADKFLMIAKRLPKEMNIYMYTGYTFEELADMNDKVINELLSYIDVLVDGRFIESEKSYDLLFRGSKNQRLINAKESVKLGYAVQYE